jgi:hypothetical protein
LIIKVADDFARLVQVEQKEARADKI